MGRGRIACALAGALTLAGAREASAQSPWKSDDGVRAAIVRDADGVALCIETPKGKRLSAEAGIVVQLKAPDGRTDDAAHRSEIFGAGYLPARHRHDLPDPWPWTKRKARVELGVCLEGDDACLPVFLEFPPLAGKLAGKPLC